MEFSKEQIKAIFIAVIIIFIIVLLFFVVAFITINNASKENKNIDVSGQYASIKELIEHYNCKYKNDTYKKDREFPTEVNLIFAKLPYENENSNEEFYNNILGDMAKFVKYTNFQMIDTQNKINIKVICKNGQIYQTIINDIEDYFIYMDSQLEVTQYEEIKTVSLNTDIEVLNYLIDNGWTADANFGTRESIFENYNIYFDEGIKYRKIGSKVYNVIFTDKYEEPVINNIKVGSGLNAVKENLGKPSFEDEDLGVIGYKGKNIYAFFTKDSISIYKNISYDYSTFWNLIEEFVEEDMTFKDFMNKLTDLWPDYSEYVYSSDYMFMAYPNKGIEIKLNYDELSGIIVYNNISEDLKTTKKYLKNTELISRLKLDSVFEAEKRRIAKEKDFLEKCKENEEKIKSEDQKLEKQSMHFYTYFDKDENENTIKVLFKSKNMDYPDRELNEAVDTFFWLTDDYFIYSIYEEGIYLYNCIDGSKMTITENGKEDFKIDSFNGNILEYDGLEIVLEY